MATQNTKTAAPVSKSATHYGLSIVADDKSTTFRDECAPRDSLDKRADQLEALLGELVAGTSGEMNADVIHTLTWLAHDLSHQIKLLVEVR